MNGWIWAVVVLAAIWLFLQCRIYVRIQYTKDATKDRFVFQVSFFNYIRLCHWAVDDTIGFLIDHQLQKIMRCGAKEQTKPEKDDSGDRRGLEVMRILLRYFACRELFCKLKVATEDAGRTALFYGAANIAKTFTIRYFRDRVNFITAPCITVFPDFQAQHAEVEFRCIFSAKFGNLIPIIKIFI